MIPPARLVSFMVLQDIEFRDMLPRSKVGKLLRRDIRDEERRRKQNLRKEVSFTSRKDAKTQKNRTIIN